MGGISGRFHLQKICSHRVNGRQCFMNRKVGLLCVSKLRLLTVCTAKLRNHDQLQNGVGFEDRITTLSGEEKRRFLEFAKRMITWCPRERSTAKDLLKDPWLYTGTSS